MPSFIMRSNESPNRCYVYDIALKQMFELLLTGSNPGVLISSDKSMSMSEDNDLMYFELHNSDNTCIPFCFVNAISSTQEFNTIYANNVNTLKYILTNNNYRGRVVNPSVEWSNNVHQVYQSKYKNITNYAIIKDTDPWYADTSYICDIRGVSDSSQNSYNHDLTENSKSPISNSLLNHDYTNSVYKPLAPHMNPFDTTYYKEYIAGVKATRFDELEQEYNTYYTFKNTWVIPNSNYNCVNIYQGGGCEME